MSELKPWIEEGAPAAIAQLLKAARREEPSAESLPRALAAVGAGVVTASTTAATAATLGKVGAIGAKASLVSAVSVVQWMLIGAGVGGAAVTMVQLQRQSEQVAPLSVPPANKSSAPKATAQSRPNLPRVVLPQIAEVPSSKSIAPPGSRSTMERDRAPLVPAPLPTPIDSEHLSEEVRAIDQANAALVSGRPEQALSALNQYDQVYRQPRFAPEALYLRMEALAQLGSRPEANRVAQRLVDGYPNSPQAAKARFRLSQTIP